MINYKEYKIEALTNNFFNLSIEEKEILARKLPLEDIIIFLFDNNKTVRSIVNYRLKFEKRQ